MRKVRNLLDGCVHFSDLKAMGDSPAHYEKQCLRPDPPTRPMRVGTATHLELFGPRKVGRKVAVYPGDQRRGKVWDDYRLANAACEILTQPEWEEGQLLANVVRNNLHYQLLMKGAEVEVPLRWSDGDVECATGGVDILTPTVLADVKTCTTSEPGPFMSFAWKMDYHTQLCFYDDGATAKLLETAKDLLGDEIDRIAGVPRRLILIAVESSDPYPVTIFELDAEVIDIGRKRCRLWLEQLRLCEAQDSWPAYAQNPVPFTIPSWMVKKDDDEVEDNP